MIGSFVKRNVNQRVERASRVALALQSGVAIIVGVLLLVSPKDASLLLTTLIGVFCLIAGVAMIASIVGDRKEWGWRLAGGVGGIVSGALVLLSPAWTAYIGAALVVWLIAGVSFANGAVMLVRGFANSRAGQILMGIFGLAFGLLLAIAAPLASLGVPWLLGASALVLGAVGMLIAARKNA